MNDISSVPSIDAAKLLNEISDFIRRFVVMTRAQADACALWILHTHALDAADFTPYLHVHSATFRSGKSVLLEVLELLVFNPWLTGRVTPATLVRKLSMSCPTLLLDESDAALTAASDYSETLRGVLNTGFNRDGKYSICVQRGNDWEPTDFSTFGPKAIAGIGRLPVTCSPLSERS